MKEKTTPLDFRYKLHIKRFGVSDIEPDPNDIKIFKQVIEECDDNYPGIDKWFEKKVRVGLREKGRGGILLFRDEEVIGASVIKRGKEGKLCSLRIKPDAEMAGFGTILMALSIFELRKSKDIHFTIPEGLWESKKDYFRKYGFSFIGKSKKQYRNYEDELFCIGSFKNAWAQVVSQLGEISETLSINKNSGNADLILSVKPEYAKKIIRGEKTVELRRKFSKKWEGSNILIYSSKPNQRIVGEAKIEKIVKRSPVDIWFEYQDSVGCDKDAFFSYSNGIDEITALLLSDIKPLNEPVPLFLLNAVNPGDNEIIAPQSHCEIRDDFIYPFIILYDSLLNVRR